MTALKAASSAPVHWPRMLKLLPLKFTAGTPELVPLDVPVEVGFLLLDEHAATLRASAAAAVSAKTFVRAFIVFLSPWFTRPTPTSRWWHRRSATARC